MLPRPFLLNLFSSMMSGRVFRTGVSSLALITAASLLTTPLSAQSTMSLGLTAYKQAVAENIGDDDRLAAFYRARHFSPIWTGPSEEHRNRREALLEAFAMAENHGLPRGLYDENALLARLEGAHSGKDLGEIEVELSRIFLSLAHDLQSGIINNPGRIDSDIKRRPARRDNMELLERLFVEDPHAVMHSLPPQTPEYTRLMREKLRLERVIARDGWGPTVPGGKLSPGQSGSSVVKLRDRLTAMGYLAPTLSATYDDQLTAAVSDFQNAHGLKEDGVAGSAALKEINTSPVDRLKSVLVAMERERWLNLPQGRGKRHIWVNLVDFNARVVDDGKVTFKTRSVIGHRDANRRSPEFSDVMDHIVINPSWYIPRSIIVNEYLPKLRSNSGAVGHLQIVDSRGQVVNRGRGFSQYSAASFPFSMRQPPGPRNALGSVKFMFPNKYNIYLHDTPSKSLFNRDVRAFSHGCIRLADPHDFAYALLAKQSDTPKQYFDSVLNSGRETRVNLKQHVPVHLVYRTAYSQAKGPMNYRGDVYGRDAKIWSALQREGVALGQAGS